MGWLDDLVSAGMGVYSDAEKKGIGGVGDGGAKPTESFPLKKGMKGVNVKVLQQHLGVTVDGVFGSATEAALNARYGITSISESKYLSIIGTIPSPTATTPTVQTKKNNSWPAWLYVTIGLAIVMIVYYVIKHK